MPANRNTGSKPRLSCGRPPRLASIPRVTQGGGTSLSPCTTDCSVKGAPTQHQPYSIKTPEHLQDSVSTSPVRSQARGSSMQDTPSQAEADGGPQIEPPEQPPSPSSVGSAAAVSPLKRSLSRIRTHSPASPSRLKPGMEAVGPSRAMGGV